jgi:hypothetical protein
MPAHPVLAALESQRKVSIGMSANSQRPSAPTPSARPSGSTPSARPSGSTPSSGTPRVTLAPRSADPSIATMPLKVQRPSVLAAGVVFLAIVLIVAYIHYS